MTTFLYLGVCTEEKNREFLSASIKTRERKNVRTLLLFWLFLFRIEQYFIFVKIMSLVMISQCINENIYFSFLGV